MSNKIKMPKTRAEFEEYIENAFLAGCNHGYAIEHTADICEQEKIGVLHYLGKISTEEFNKKTNEFYNENKQEKKYENKNTV